VSRKYIAYVARHHIGLLALFVALGGTSYAVVAGSIGSREIKDNSVRSKDVRDGEIRSVDVHDGSLLAKDFGPGELPGQAFGRFKDGPIFTTDGRSDLIALSLPAGSYLIFAKATVFAPQAFECRLSAGQDFDRAQFGQPAPGDEVLTLTVLHRSTAPFTANLQCPDNDPGQAFRLTDVKLHALRVASISNSAG
jgi:hypothetical protein